MPQSTQKEPPSLEALLEKRGVKKSQGYGDYFDYIAESKNRGVVARLLRFPRVFVQGSMHLALGKTQSVTKFWAKADKA